MSTLNLPVGVAHRSFDEIDSTNSEARRTGEGAVDAGQSIQPTWITAKRQTAGRGRQGRVWSTGAGQNFAGTLLIDPDCAPAEAAKLSL